VHDLDRARRRHASKAIDWGSTIAMLATARRVWKLPLRPSLLVAAVMLASTLFPTLSLADQGGVSFWIPGTFGSLAAVPPSPGWSLTIVNYYTSVTAAGDIAAARLITIGKLSPTVMVSLNATYRSNLDSVNINPSYAFATPVLGGTLSLGMTASAGPSSVGIDGTLTLGVGSLVAMRQGSISGSVTGFGDLDPIAQLFWSSGNNNWFTFLTGDIPVGTYNSSNLANVGIGHGAVDGGGGYTYLDAKTGREFSVVTGLTYNLINPSTDYQNGIDWHLDWGLSQALSKQIAIGAVGYIYDQLTGDSGAGDRVGPFESRVFGVGPQIGFTFAAGTLAAYLNFKGYWELDAARRPSGWNAWATLSLSPNTPVAGKPIVVK
jgi:hypothetical protein